MATFVPDQARMTPEQVRSIALLTSNMHDAWKFDGGCISRVEPMTTSKDVIVVMSNITDERKWFMPGHCVVVIVGPKGGYKKTRSN